MSFENKTVLITGGSTGIGLATTQAFIKEGANVIITGKNPDNLKKAAAEINHPKLQTIVSDTANLASIAALEKTIETTGNKLDVLFLNAGIAFFGSIEQTTEEAFDAQFNVNVKGLFFTLSKLIPHLKNGASVLVTSSGAATTSMVNASAYSATKAAVNAIARVAANELADRQIRVNIVSPGPVETPILGKTGLPAEVINGFKEQLVASTISKRIGTPEEIAQTVLFLASDAASFISGTELLVDGGLINYSLK